MRLAVSRGRIGIVSGERFMDAAIADSGIDPDPVGLFMHWERLKNLVYRDELAQELDMRDLGVPFPAPRQIFGVGLNYRDHAAEAGLELPAVPMIFLKAPSSVAGPNDTVALSSGFVDWEGELVVVIGREARDVARADAWRFVAGYTIGQDLSDRVVQFEAGGTPQFGLGKSAPGFAPVGPFLVTPDEAPGSLAIKTSVNGVTKQSSSTGQLIFDVPALIEHLSARVRLLPGDLIFTGTPEGVGWTREPRETLRPGDVVITTIDRLGTLTTQLEA